MVSNNRFFKVIAVVCVLGTPFFMHARSRKSRRKKRLYCDVQQMDQKSTPEKSILFNLNGVLLTEDTSKIVSKIGAARVATYALTHWCSPLDACLNVLEKMGNEPDQKAPISFMFKERKMPRCIVEWQQGKCTYDEVQKKLISYIEKLHGDGFFASNSEKNITQNIIELVLNPREFSEVTKLIIPMTRLVQELKAKGYKLYIFANIAAEAMDAVKKAYPELIAQFDGIVTSSLAQAVKPEKKIFNHLFDTYKLDPKQCILVDNDQSMLDVAQTFGIQGVLFVNPKETKNRLKILGIA